MEISKTKQTNNVARSINLPGIKQMINVFFLIGLIIGAQSFVANSDIYHKWISQSGFQSNSVAFLMMAVVYMVLLSIPFFPGVELGILLMCLGGKNGILVIYLFTILGLILSFWIGRSLPERYVKSLLTKRKSNPNKLNVDDPVQKMLGAKLMTLVKKYPYFLIGILLNLPGNFIIGGGGGVAMLSGLNQQITSRYFVFTTALAVLPLPLLSFLGLLQLEALL